MEGLLGSLDTSGVGWVDSVNSSSAKYCTTPPCSEPPAPYWPSPSYLQYLTVITVDANCYGWVLEHANIYQKTTRVSQGNDWVSYRGQRPSKDGQNIADNSMEGDWLPIRV